jgi:hypothetical protein
MKRLFLLVAFLLIASPAWAADYYVNKSGGGTTCSVGSPCLTIAIGISKLAAGDTLHITDATTVTYAESIDNTIPSGSTCGAPTTVVVDTARMATINGVTANSYVVEIENKDNIKIDGFVIDAAAATLAGITIGDDAGGLGGAGSTCVTLTNSEIKNADVWSCISTHTSGSTVKNDNITISNNIVHNCGTTNPTTDTFDGHGIYPVMKNGTVSGNTVYDVGNTTIGGAAIHQYFDGNAGMNTNVYKNNTVYNNYGSAFTIFDGTDVLIYNNIMYNNALKAEGAGGIYINGVTTAGIYNNTIYDNNDAGILMATCTSVTIRNNIYYLNGSATSGSCTSTTTSNNLSTDPSFVNAAGANFHLTLGSTAIDTGTTVASVTTDFDAVTRPKGAAYDIGAFEFQTTPGGAGINIFASPVIRGR